MKVANLTGAKTLLEKYLPNVPRGTWDQLLRYIDLTMTWNPSINLTGAKDPNAFFHEQILDCVAAYQVLPKIQGYMDLGTGAGLPGLVWAILDPKRRFILVEILKKRAAFLQRAKGELEIKNVVILQKSFEKLSAEHLPKDFELVSRGTWPPQSLLRLAASTPLPWKTWWVFSNENLHRQYLKFSPTYTIRAESLEYPRSEGEMGLLTRLDRRD